MEFKFICFVYLHLLEIHSHWSLFEGNSKHSSRLSQLNFYLTDSKVQLLIKIPYEALDQCKTLSAMKEGEQNNTATGQCPQMTQECSGLK